jgi:hypothetical protein
MITIPEDSDWIEVDSAFGGFAIYRRSSLADTAAYEGVECEHVTFHDHIRRNGGRIFINPKLINGVESGHSEWVRKLVEPPQAEGAASHARRLMLRGVKAIIGADTYNAIRSYIRPRGSSLRKNPEIPTV